MFDDLLEANKRYREEFHDSGVTGRAARGLAVLTCIDSRIDPLAMLGLRTGDAKIVRNAGARATDDAIRSLVLASNLLGAERICVVQHTECAMAASTEEGMRARVSEASGADASGWEFLVMDDQLSSLQADIDKIRACPLIPATVKVAGMIFDVHTGELRQVIKSSVD